MNTRGSSKSEPLLKIIAEQDMIEAMRLIRDIGQYEHSAYLLAHRPNSPTDLPYFKSTYPHAWLGRYIENEYFNIDPVMLDGFDRVEPFFWSKLEKKTGKRDAFFEDAFQHGIGRTGFSIPLNDRSQRRAMFSVTSYMDEENWRRKIDGEREMLIQIGDALHRKAVRQVYGTDEGPALSAREIECLYWTARGKDCASAADIIRLSEHTVRDYLKSARRKLGCVTIAQTIHEATKQRLI